MSWSDFHARSAFLNEVLAAAAQEMATLPDRDPAVVPAWRLINSAQARLLFGSADGVLLALQHRWTTHLTALLDAALEEGRTARSAWAQLAQRAPALRTILDAAATRSGHLQTQQLSEQRIMNEHIDFQFNSMTSQMTRPAQQLFQATTADEAVAS